MLQKEVETWLESRENSQAAHQERVQLEGACWHLQGQIDRLIDAYQQGALDVDELKVRREQLEASLQATRASRAPGGSTRRGCILGAAGG